MRQCLAVIIVIIMTLNMHETSIKATGDVDYRLPQTVWPSFYEIQLEPYLSKSDRDRRFTFFGHIYITLKATEYDIKKITLHAKTINITKALFYEASNKNHKLYITVGNLDSITDKFDVTLDTALIPANNYILEFEYTGILGDDMFGFYRSNYTNEKGKEIWIASTNFEPYSARRAFPSFDEPKFKAKFMIDITHPLKYSVISNTQIDRITDIPSIGKRITFFKPTPRMSTYLLAFLISDFRPRDNNINFTVIARPEAYSQTEYAAQIGPKLLKILEEFTGFPYKQHNIGKLHLAAIPDFSAGAMENWGLLTYRETALLFDSNASTAFSQQRVASVITHEMSHMWFGDLVTCDWWSYTWLNEGFGRYFQYFTTHVIEPSWELDKQFVVEQIHPAMHMDSQPGATPMTDMTVASPEELDRMFNTISYNKGASIIRMIKHMLTETKFKRALQNYLRENQFGTSTPAHLFRAFNSEWTNSAVNLTELLVDWTEQIGYPVVTVTLKTGGKSFKVSQQRFVLYKNEDAPLLWNIPFTYTTDTDMNFNDTIPKIYLPKTKDEKWYDLPKAANWIIGNVQESGYYRVNYDKNTWQKIRKALLSDKYGGIHELNRAQIVNDVFNLGFSGFLDYELVFDILDYLKRETNYLPWRAAFVGFEELAARLGNEREKDFTPYILDTLKNIYESVGFNKNEGESIFVTYNRANVLSWACKYGHMDCIKDSKKAFSALAENNINVEVNIRSVVYCTAIREGNSIEFEYLWKKYEGENLASEKNLILAALGCSTNRKQLLHYMDLILTKEVRLQDKQAAFHGTFSSNEENVQIVFDYVLVNFNKMIISFGSKPLVAKIISAMAFKFTTPKQREALDVFIERNGAAFGTAVITLKNALKNVDFNVKWSESSINHVLNNLKNRSNAATRLTINVLLLLLLFKFCLLIF